MFPAVASKSFANNKNKLLFRKILFRILNKLRSLKLLTDRVNYIHNQVDRNLQIVTEDPIAKKLLSCKKGCSACCHTQVSVTSDEALYYAGKILSGEIKVDLKRLAIQAKVKNNSEDYFKIPYELRKCIFLNNKNACSIYEDRPTVCRTNLVISDKKDCLTEDGIEKPIRLLKTERADTVIIGAFSHSKTNGTLPYMIYKIINILKI